MLQLEGNHFETQNKAFSFHHLQTPASGQFSSCLAVAAQLVRSQYLVHLFVCLRGFLSVSES